jgi:PAS domain S-box-containing protein
LYLSAEIGRQRLESIIIAIPDPVLVTDQNDNLLFINPAAQEKFHLYEQNLVGEHVSKLISDRNVLQLLQNAREDPHSEELTIADGKTFVATTLLIEGAGEPAGRICILRDVTSFKQLDTLKSEFVSTVSHDLRSPLALIQGYTSMLKMVGELNDQQTNILNKITAESVKMNQLITNLLDLGRIEAGVGLKLERRPVDYVVNQVISEIQEQADQKRVALIIDLPSADLPSVQADQPLLQQSIHNLVDNAIKFTEPGGKVTLGVQITDESVTYIIRDNGIGISPTDQQSIFEKFFRANEHGEVEDEGSGLGLAIVKSIADKHGGKVEVESKLGEGSSFLLTIPLNQE